MLNRRQFFATVRASLFGGQLQPQQVSGLSAILDAWERNPANRDERFLAYILATTHHETAQTMQPIREYGDIAYLTRMYDIRGARPALARRMGNTTPGDGVRYCGRGYVQLTWKSNYRRAGDALGIDLVTAPEHAMDPAIAADIMLRGMCEGWFTGRKLADFFTEQTSDWRGARRIINGTDRAVPISAYARAYHAALSAVIPVQPRAARTSAKAPLSAKAQPPSARKSAPVATSGFTAAGSGA